MSRKDYQTTAEIIKRNRDMTKVEPMSEAANETLRSVASDLADMFKRDNSRFDRGRFMEACGL